MVGSVSRNYFSGLASGMDTDSLIEATIKAESSTKYSLERKRNTLSLQQEMLQDVNLKLYNLQTKASDLLLSKTFTTKQVTSSDDKLVSAKATTGAATGSYKVRVKQLATATSVASSGKVAGSLMNGHALTSANKLGGSATKLSDLGVENDAGQTYVGINLNYTATNGSIHNLNITNINQDDTIETAINKINAQIANNSEFKGKVAASYDEKNNQVRLTALDTAGITGDLTISDMGGDGFASNLFGSNTVGLNFTLPAKASNVTLRSGLNATKADLGLDGTFTINKNGTTATIDLSGLASDASMSDIIAEMNNQIGQAGGSFSKTGAATTNPEDLTSEFRFNSITGKLELVNTDATETNQITVADGTGDFASKMFGSSSVTSSMDNSRKLSEETFAIKPTSGIFTVDGVQIEINTDTDTLESVLSKITSLTNVKATYDSKNDTISFTRKDGSTDPIGIGSSTDTSNFLKITGMVSGTQDGATLTGSRGISGINADSTLDNAGFAIPVTKGSFTINGVKFEIKNTESTTVQSVIDMINNNDKVGVKAQYDPTSGKFILSSRETGNQSIAIGAAGDTSNFLSSMGLTNAVQQVGQNAIYNIDGMFGGADQVSQSNSISDAIEGVTFELKGITTESGETIDVKVDSESALNTVKEFIDSYNEVTELIYGYLTEERQKDSSDNYLEALSDEEKDQLDADTLEAYESAYKVGLLRGDSTLRSIRSQLRNVMSSIVKGVNSEFNSLSDIGISTGAIGSSYTETMVGKLEIKDEEALKKAIEESPNDISSLFNAETGIARKLKETLNSFTSSSGILTKRVGRSDSSVSNEFSTQIDSINKQISAQQLRLNARQEALIKQFAELETAMSNYQSQSSTFASYFQK